MAEPVVVTEDNFQREVLSSDMPVLVDFWAEWCGPCRMIAPSVKQIASEYSGSLKVGKLDTDENPAIAMRYGVMSIPTLMLFKGGKVVTRMTGVQPKDRIVAQIMPHVGQS